MGLVSCSYTFVRVLLGHALCHLGDDVAHLPRVLLDADLLLGVEVGLHRVTQHDLRQHRHRAGGGVRTSLCNGRRSDEESIRYDSDQYFCKRPQGNRWLP